MSVNLKTDCDNCVHVKVCRYVGKADHFAERLKNLTYGPGLNDDYGWDIMSDHYQVQIDISCKDFTEQDVRVKQTELEDFFNDK